MIPQIESKGYTLVRYNTAHDLTIQDKDGYLYDTILYNVNTDMKFDKFGYDNIHTADNIVKYIENNHIPTKLLDIENVKDKKYILGHINLLLNVVNVANHLKTQYKKYYMKIYADVHIVVRKSQN